MSESETPSPVHPDSTSDSLNPKERLEEDKVGYERFPSFTKQHDFSIPQSTLYWIGAKRSWSPRHSFAIESVGSIVRLPLLGLLR